MFGQALAIFFPPLVNATTVFMTGHNPDQVVAQVRRHRVTLVVAVPRVMEMLRDRARQLAPRCAAPAPAEHPLLVRLWRAREVHRLFGWRFCGFVVGGAPLDAELEDYWRRLGYAVIQGYGLTETAPIVAWNHPFRRRPGTVGRPLEGVDVRIAPDGEILVRGPTVTSGYLQAPEETRAVLEEGWLHTGDIGAFDDGHLIIRGRKKDVIATAEGLKVFPEDVERVLDAMPGVREAAVVGRRADGDERVHAVLVVAPGDDPSVIVREANAKLEAYQRVRDFSLWPSAALPRSEPMRKLKRFEIRRWVEEGQPERPGRAAAATDAIGQLLAKYVESRVVKPETTLDELGLTSLDRLELMMAMEERAGVPLSETAMSEARTVSDLSRLTAQATETGVTPDVTSFPSWNRWPVLRLVRDVSQATWILPLAGIFARLRVEGSDHLRGLAGPVIFAANHQSHFDTPVILKALPARWRRGVAVAMAREFFDPHFYPERHSIGQRLMAGVLYYLAALFFNGFPLPRQEPGTRQTLQYIGELATAGISILIFPEGHRTERGEIKPFQPGVGLLGSRLRLPVVPVRLEGVDRVLHQTWHWPRRGDVRVTFGAPLALEGADYAALARRVREAVVSLQPSPVDATPRAPDAAA
jgi:long-chain acyl-CoA synthetase